MAIKLGSRPKNFKPFTVKFTMPDGSDGAIEVTYKYRTRTEFGQFLNEILKDAGEENAKPGQIDFEALFAKTRDKNAVHLIESLDAWNLEFDLTVENLRQLADEVPAACVAMMAAYSAACNEGRLGN